MLTKNGCVERQRRLWQRLPESIEWVLIGDRRHVRYFSGFQPDPVSFSADQQSALLLFRDGRSVLLAVNFTHRTATTDVFVSEEVIPRWYDHQHSVQNRDHALADIVRTQTSDLAADRGLVEREGLSGLLVSAGPSSAGEFQSTASTADPVTLGALIRDLRRSKLPDEIDLLKTCMQAGAAGQAAAFDVIRPGVTELEVYLAVQAAAQRSAGRVCVVYGDFRATNAQRFKAGGLPTEAVLQDGDLMILDFSVVIGGYRSDFTNTVAVGEPADLQSAQADACVAALQAAEQTLAAGVACSDVFRAAEQVLQERGFDGLPHHAGHGLGMEHPEPPILVAHSTDVLRAGDVVTLEPGLYVEGTGGMRFEHNYVITENGCERLSQHHLGLQKV